MELRWSVNNFGNLIVLHDIPRGEEGFSPPSTPFVKFNAAAISNSGARKEREGRGLVDPRLREKNGGAWQKGAREKREEGWLVDTK